VILLRAELSSAAHCSPYDQPMGELVNLRREAAPQDTQGNPRAVLEPLWREAVGHHLRRERQTRGERLVDIASRAGLSTQYLSEIERGRKDPSSEMLAAVASAVRLSLGELTLRVAHSTIHGPTCLAA
jgi:DNA-binding XRE family transcriptional regulator